MRLIVMIAVFAGLSTGHAWSQTPEQCRVLANAIPKMTGSMYELEQNMKTFDWSTPARASSGKMSSSLGEAKIAHDEFMAALRKYRSAMEDVAYFARRCDQ